MSTRQSLTVATTVRIFKAQAAALGQLKLTGGASASALVRVLLQLYFSGEVPRADALVRADMQRAEKALRSGQYAKES